MPIERADEDEEADPVEASGRRAGGRARLRALTTGAASSTMVCQGTRPVRTMATPM